jgi:hypothetical protein
MHLSRFAVIGKDNCPNHQGRRSGSAKKQFLSETIPRTNAVRGGTRRLNWLGKNRVRFSSVAIRDHPLASSPPDSQAISDNKRAPDVCKPDEPMVVVLGVLRVVVQFALTGRFLSRIAIFGRDGRIAPLGVRRV